LADEIEMQVGGNVFGHIAKTALVGHGHVIET
jgi:hypothetical protein